MSKIKLRREFKTQWIIEESERQQKEFGSVGFHDLEDYWEALLRFKEVLERESPQIESDKSCFDTPLQDKAEQGGLGHRPRTAIRMKSPARCIQEGIQQCAPKRTRRDYGYEH